MNVIVYSQPELTPHRASRFSNSKHVHHYPTHISEYETLIFIPIPVPTKIRKTVKSQTEFAKAPAKGTTLRLTIAYKKATFRPNLSEM